MEQDFSWLKWSKQEGNRTQQGAGRKSPGDQGDAEMRPISLAQLPGSVIAISTMPILNSPIPKFRFISFR